MTGQQIVNSQDIVVRRFKPEDYDGIVSLWASAGLGARLKGRDSAEKINQQVRDGNTALLVAELNGRIVGTALGTHDSRKGWINRLAVHPEFRRKSIATRLVAEAEKWLEERGLEVIACLIEVDNTTSIELFQKLGYEEWDGKYFSKRSSSES